MCALYDHPERSWGHISVSDPDPEVDEPPGPAEGRVVSIDLEHVYVTATDSNWRRCQMCPRTICYAYPHIMAFVWLEKEPAIGSRCARAYFCSRECLGCWASRGETVGI